MKRNIIIQVLLLIILGTLIYFSVCFWSQTSTYIKLIHSISGYDYEVKSLRESLNYVIVSGILSTAASLIDIIVMIIIAIKDFHLFEPLISKIKQHSNNKKEAKKQAKISKLENELNDLKGSE